MTCRKAYGSSTAHACKQLLCLAEYWATHDGVQQAHQQLERMRLTNVPAEPYIEAATVAAVYKVRAPSNSVHFLQPLLHGQSVEAATSCYCACVLHSLQPVLAIAAMLCFCCNQTKQKASAIHVSAASQANIAFVNCHPCTNSHGDQMVSIFVA